MGYVVIKEFTDKIDKQKYMVGDRYPHRGFAKKERLEELSSKKNQRGVVLIQFKESDETEEPEKAETKKKSTKK